LAVDSAVNPRTPLVDRSFLSDFWRVLASVLIGVLVGSPLSYVLHTPLPVQELVAIVVAPALLVLVLVNYRRRICSLSLMRTAGAIAGLIAFYVLYREESFTQPIDAMRVPLYLVTIYSTVAVVLLGLGLVAAELAWRGIRAGGRK